MASFVPEEDIQELRSLMRTRKQLSREQTRHVQRIQKTLEEANIKLDSVISDIMGASGRRMIRAMIEGVRDPHKLAALAGKGLKASPKELYDALHGRLTGHHRFLLKLISNNGMVWTQPFWRSRSKPRNTSRAWMRSLRTKRSPFAP